MRKTCVQTVERLAAEWCSAEGGEALPGFREFVMKQVGGWGRMRIVVFLAAAWLWFGCVGCLTSPGLSSLADKEG